MSFLFMSFQPGGVVAWIEKSAVCHSRKSGNPDFFCHAELVSVSFLVDPEINSG